MDGYPECERCDRQLPDTAVARQQHGLAGVSDAGVLWYLGWRRHHFSPGPTKPAASGWICPVCQERRLAEPDPKR
jgi:hypothetical protein